MRSAQIPERTGAILASLLLGLLCLLVVPIYFALNPIDAATLRSIDGFAAGDVVLFAGESPAGVLMGLLILPLLIWTRPAQTQVTRVRLQIAIALSLLFAIGQVGSVVFAVTDRSIPLFQPAPGCTIITCGLHHTLFHLSQAPFALVVAYFSYRIYSAPRSTRAGQVAKGINEC